MKLSYKASPPSGALGVDLDRLIASRLLIQSHSGGGKSRAVRQLLEETHGRVQQLIIDPEGEFASLREKFDYVLAAKTGGDVVASPKHARLLCRRLVELGASAVLDISDLDPGEKREFVKLFLLELLALPRDLWHPIIVVVDEAHDFAPQTGEAQSLGPMISLASKGRKRGFCAVFATQRISKLHKDAAADLRNKMIGGATLDVDMKRAGEELGFDKERRRELRLLEPGEFYVYGPALSKEIVKVKTGDVQTSHPDINRRTGVTPPPPPPPAKIKAILAKIGDLPKEAEATARSEAELRAEVERLGRDLRNYEKNAPVKVKFSEPDPLVIQKAVLAERQRCAKVTTAIVHHVLTASQLVAGNLKRSLAGIESLETWIKSPDATIADILPGRIQGRHATTTVVDDPIVAKTVRETTRKIDREIIGDLPKGPLAILTAAVQLGDEVDRAQISAVTGYKKSSRDTYISYLMTAGYLEIRHGHVCPTEAGVAAVGDIEPLPTGEALLDHWYSKLPEGPRKILEAIATAGMDIVSRDTISEATGYKKSSRDTYISNLVTRKLVTSSAGGVKLADILVS